jgi:hypothetical protein
MPKRTLVEVNIFNKLFNLFIKAKSDNKEHEFIKNMRKKDPKLGKLYSMWNDKMDVALNQMKGTKSKLSMRQPETKCNNEWSMKTSFNNEPHEEALSAFD